jgi:hypothetical protein
MWILPKQLHTSAFVLDTKALGLDSEEFSQISEKSLTWRGKDSLSRTWLLRLKRVSWMQHLCSRTLKPSHTESFLDAWTSSLGDSRVSLSRLLENVKQQKTQDTSSLTSQKESENVNLELFSSKMLQESSQPKPQTENQFSNMSSENWKAWVTEQRQEYSQRKKLAHLTREKESLSWATPNTMDVLPARCPEKLAKAKKKGGCKNLREEVMNWQTTMDIERTPEGMKKRKAYRESIGRKYVEGCLTEQVKNWLTPRVLEVDEDYESYQKRMQESGNPKNVGKKNPANLTMQVKNWPTARTSDAEGGRIDTEMTEQGGELADSEGEGLQGHARLCAKQDWGCQLTPQSLWPSRPAEQQHEWEEPRVIESQLGRTVNGNASRVDRLRLLGNGVVPATAAKAFITLIQRLV